MRVWSLFVIGLMGLFFYNKIGSIIPMVVLPTTEIQSGGHVGVFDFGAQAEQRVLEQALANIVGRKITPWRLNNDGAIVKPCLPTPTTSRR